MATLAGDARRAAIGAIEPATESGWTGQAEQSPILPKLMPFDFAKLV